MAFLVEHFFRQAKFRNLRAHHAARQRVLLEHDAFVTHRGEIARDGQRRRATAHKRDALAVLFLGRLGQAGADIVLKVGGDALEPADRDRLLLHPAAAACGLARPVTRASEHAGKHVHFPIDHVRVAVAASRDQTDVFGNRRVRRAGPLTIHDLVEIIRDRNVGRFHSIPLARSAPPLTFGGIRHRCADRLPPAVLLRRRFRARILVEVSVHFYRL